MTNKTPRIAKNRRESTTPGTRKTGKLFFFLSFFFFFFFFFFFRQLSSTLPQSVTMVFARNSSIFNRAVQRPIAFSLPPSLHQAAAAAHSINMASFVTPFSRLYACALNPLTTEFFPPRQHIFMHSAHTTFVGTPLPQHSLLSGQTWWGPHTWRDLSGNTVNDIHDPPQAQQSEVKGGCQPDFRPAFP